MSSCLSTRFFDVGITGFRQKFQHFVAVIALYDDNTVFGTAAGCTFVLDNTGQLGKRLVGTFKALDDRGLLSSPAPFESDAKYLFLWWHHTGILFLLRRFKVGIGRKHESAEVDFVAHEKIV